MRGTAINFKISGASWGMRVSIWKSKTKSSLSD
jgi:hypothetical protein